MSVVVNAVIQVLILLLFARAIASFFIRDWSRGLPRLLWDFTEPILAPVRRVIPPLGGLDFSVMIVIFALYLLQALLLRSL